MMRTSHCLGLLPALALLGAAFVGPAVASSADTALTSSRAVDNMTLHGDEARQRVVDHFRVAAAPPPPPPPAKAPPPPPPPPPPHG